MQSIARNTEEQQDVPYRLQPKTHSLVKKALNQKDKIFDLMQQYGSPLNILFPQIFREKYELFDELLAGEHLNYRLYYTCKPNRSNALLREAASLGSYVDVSSLGEFQAAIDAGVPAQKLSATGPKNKAYMNAVIVGQSLCVIDNWFELNYLKENAQSSQPIMLRLSSPQDGGPSQDDTFGFHFDEIENLISEIEQFNQFDFHGFACHYSGAFDNVRFRHIEMVLKATLKSIDHGLTPQAINIGGGYQVGYAQSGNDWKNFITSLKQAVIGEGEPITWDNAGMGFRLQNGDLSGSANFMDHYQSITGDNHLEKILYTSFDAIDGVPLLDFIRDSGLALYVEPGRSLMDQCGVTLAEVNFIKKSAKGHWLANLDMHHANLNAHAFKYMVEPVVLNRQDNPTKNKEGVLYYGSLCFASDLITFHKTFPDHMPQSGDVIAFLNTAGYRMDFAESEMLRHPNAQKICLMHDNDQWTHTPDNDYKGEAAK
jgi:diaminopimelate decarboxylase